MLHQLALRRHKDTLLKAIKRCILATFINKITFSDKQKMTIKTKAEKEAIGSFPAFK